MKKVAIGCAVVAGALALVLGIGAFWAFRAARGYVEDLAVLNQIPAMNEQIEDQSPYHPPADERMDADQVAKYAEVQRTMRQVLGARLDELEEKYSVLQEMDRDPTMREVLGVWSDVATLVVQAKQAQVDAINAAGLSLEEYHWIRQQTLAALGYGVWGWDVEAIAEDPTEMLEAMQETDPPDAETLQYNRALLSDYEDELEEEWLALSFFGL